MDKKVLVAESDSTVLQVISYFMKLEGFEVTAVADGTVALDVALRVRPDVILLDPGLAGVNGIRLSRDIRDRAEFKNVPILYLVENIDVLYKTGEDIPPGYGLIHKPIDPTRMVNAIRECMEELQPASVEQVEPISIEDLLGWNVSEESVKEKDVLKGPSEVAMDIPSAIITDTSGAAFVLTDSETVPEEEVVATVNQNNGQNNGGLSVTEPPAGMPADTEAGTTGSNEGEQLAEAAEVETPVMDIAHDELSKMFSADVVKDMINRIGREIIEKVVRDVVPVIAEEEIKKEIERLKGEAG